jgi:hypothetical protein
LQSLALSYAEKMNAFLETAESMSCLWFLIYFFFSSFILFLFDYDHFFRFLPGSHN